MILIWGLALLIGCGVGLHPHWIFTVPFIALSLLTKRKVQVLFFLFLGVALALFHRPSLNETPHEGKGIFVLGNISPSQSPFHQSYALQGTLKTFETESQIHHHIPCIIFEKKIPKAGTEFYIEGKLENGILKRSSRPLETTKSRFSLARWRFEKKERVRKFCHALTDKKVGHFFASMLTGDVDDRLLSMEFRKWGLSHILAISGFHFAIAALTLGFCLRMIFAKRIADVLLIALLSYVFIYLGPSPSIVRAYLMICLYLIGQLLGRIPDPLNLLGVALVVELLISPLHAREVGFQLSFLATFGILSLFHRIDHAFTYLLPKRTVAVLNQFSFIDKHGYLFSSTIRKSLALNTSVHLVTLPILLFHFHSFPLMSFAFNLFIPPLLGVSLMGLPLGSLNIAYTRIVLDMIACAPETLNFQLFFPLFPFEVAIILCTLIGIFGLTLSPRIGQNRGLFSGDRSSVG